MTQTLLRGKYLVRNPLLYFFLKTTDIFFSLFFRNKKSSPNLFPKKILLSHLGHLGDLVIATSVLPVLKKAFPEAKIGFLTGSWSQVVLKEHPLVDKLYYFDHWKNNRSQQTFFKKMSQHFISFFKCLCELKKERYDVSVDLYYYFPNSIFLLACASIPVRIGYTSGGFGSLLTESIDWRDTDNYVSEYYKELLKKIGINDLFLKDLKPSLFLSKEKNFLSKLSLKSQQNGYIVLHIGAGMEKKEWLLEKWKELANRLLQENFFLVFTGKGRKEKEKIDWVMNGFTNVQSLCDDLSWQELLLLIQKARLLISVDTVVTHVASAFGVKNLILFSGINSPSHWKPPSSEALFFPEACFPCFNKGCSSRKCLLKLEAEDVFFKAKQLLLSC
jgi:ADP-heptose:LPS heptosyltransferase